MSRGDSLGEVATAPGPVQATAVRAGQQPLPSARCEAGGAALRGVRRQPGDLQDVDGTRGRDRGGKGGGKERGVGTGVRKKQSGNTNPPFHWAEWFASSRSSRWRKAVCWVPRGAIMLLGVVAVYQSVVGL